MRYLIIIGTLKIKQGSNNKIEAIKPRLRPVIALVPYVVIHLHGLYLLLLHADCTRGVAIIELGARHSPKQISISNY